MTHLPPSESRHGLDAASGHLTREVLEASFAAIAKQGSTPHHDCRYDGHVLHFNPGGFAWCIYCHASEAEIERPA